MAADAAPQSGFAVARMPFSFDDPEAFLSDTLPGNLAVYSGPIPQHRADYRRLEEVSALARREPGKDAVSSGQAARIENWHEQLRGLTARTVKFVAPRTLTPPRGSASLCSSRGR